MKCKRLLVTLIPLAILAACGPDADDSNAATGNTTVASISSNAGGANGSGTTVVRGGTNDNTTGTGGSSSANGSGGSGGAVGSGGSGGSARTGGSGGSGSGGSGGSGGATGGGSGDGSGDAGSGDAGSGNAGGSGDAGDPAPVIPTGPAALDVNAQTVFGFGVGPAAVKDVRDAVSKELGSVTNDTDWYTLPKTSTGGTADCIADQESRILRWGDLSIAFWRKAGTESIWSWSVGNPAVSGYDDRREPNIPASPAPTGLRTPEGISVGSSFDDLADAYGETFQFFPLTPDDVRGVHVATPDPKTRAGASLSMMEVGGPIVGIGSTLNFC